ncbi:MAG: alpha/beta fold hydrolase [Phycisphaerae bacterium]
MFTGLLSLLILLQAAVFAATPPEIPDGWSDGFVYANGIRLHYYHAIAQPDKPVIVMAHGITDNGLCWTTLTWKLQDSYDIYMVDARGHGLSDPFTQSDDGDTLVKDLAAFVQVMGFKMPILMGHSMGAATVMRAGAEFPALAGAIVMLDPPLLGGRVRAPRQAEEAPENRQAEEKAPEKQNAAPTSAPRRSAPSDRISVNMFGDPETLVRQNNYSYDDLIALGRRQNPKWGIVDVQYWALSKKQYHGAYSNEAWQVMSGTMNVGDSLAKISVPALVLKADTSPQGREANLKAAEVIQNGKLVHIDNSGHNLHHDQLESTVEVLTQFLSTLSSKTEQEFAIGADISWVPSQEDQGTVFSDKGVQKDVLEILKDNKFNWIRLRLFVEPEAENGYSKDGYCGLEQTIAMAKRVKAAGLKFLLDFHYSDTWADPGKQFTPSAWKELSREQLEEKVYSYTKETLERFLSEEAAPDMVQIGNEINNGMLWPAGKLSEEGNSFYALLRSAGKAVRDVDPAIEIMVHIAKGGDNKHSVWFYDSIMENGIDFDVIGQSYYTQWHGTLDDLRQNLTSLAERYKKKIVVVEYQDKRKEVNEIVHQLPFGLGLGTFIWEATSPRWGNLFDASGNTNQNMAIYPDFYKITSNKQKLRLLCSEKNQAGLIKNTASSDGVSSARVSVQNQ